MHNKNRKEQSPLMQEGFVRDEFIMFLKMLRTEKRLMTILNTDAHLQWRHLSLERVRDVRLSKAMRMLVNWAYHFDRKEEFIASATSFLARVWELADKHLDEFNDQYTKDL